MNSDRTIRVEQEKLNSPAAVTLEGFDKRLLAYAAVAGAGLMAAAPCAEAGVIFNPTTFTNNYPGSSSFNIDLNSDSTNDFWFGTWNQTFSYRSFYGGEMNGGQLLMQQQQVETDAQFIRGSNFIGPDNQQWVSTDRLARASGWQGSTWYSSGSNSTWWVPGGVSGQFANTGEGYLGVRIPTGQTGSYNYGWIRFNITASDQTSDMPIGVTVRGWAFEQTPDTPIHAGDEGGGVPEPGSLGLLAGGILGLAAWRRRKAAKG
jgi:hypothetical protein